MDPSILGDEGVLPQPLADALSHVAGLRNIIVHSYLTIDRQRQFEALSRRDDFRSFAADILDCLPSG